MVGAMNVLAQMTIKNSAGITIITITQEGSMAVGKSTLPTDKLDVSGNIRSSAKTITAELQVTGGSPSAGKVLSSDASGNATWTSLSGDVSGAANSITVTKLQNIPVSATQPKAGNVLKYQNSNWVPANALNYVPLNSIYPAREVSSGPPDAYYTKAQLGIPAEAKAVHIVYAYWKDNAVTRTFILVDSVRIDSQLARVADLPIEHKSAIVPFLNNSDRIQVVGDINSPSCQRCGCLLADTGYLSVLGYFY